MFQIKYSFNEIHDLKIPEWSLRNYEDVYLKGRTMINVVPLATLLFTLISPL